MRREIENDGVMDSSIAVIAYARNCMNLNHWTLRPSLRHACTYALRLVVPAFCMDWPVSACGRVGRQKWKRPVENALLPEVLKKSFISTICALQRSSRRRRCSSMPSTSVEYDELGGRHVPLRPPGLNVRVRTKGRWSSHSSLRAPRPKGVGAPGTCNAD